VCDIEIVNVKYLQQTEKIFVWIYFFDFFFEFWDFTFWSKKQNKKFSIQKHINLNECDEVINWKWKYLKEEFKNIFRPIKNRSINKIIKN
jgi:hypothetical protein